MADIWLDVDAALSEVPVNILPLIDNADWLTIEESVVYNQAGLDLVWNFVTTAGAMTQTAVVPTSGGAHDWANKLNGMYAIEIPASGGTINNDTEGFGWFTGVADGIIPWRGPVIGFRAAALNNALIDGGDVLDVSLTEIEGVAQSATDLKDFADAGYDPATNKVQGVVLVDTTTANTDMVGTDNAALASVATEARLAELDAANLPADIDAILADTADIQPLVEKMAYVGGQGLGVWIDDGAGNTNTVLGTDGTPDNPVSTIAAATTIAAALGSQRFYLMNDTSITLAQTYEGFEFVGTGMMNQVDLGSQDVDDSEFFNLTLTGTQGGTQFMMAVECRLTALLAVEIVAEGCWLIGNITMRTATNQSFDSCQSGVPGGGTPDLTFPGSGTTSVNFRHYSGGLTVKSATVNDTMSYESDGQLVIDATCTSLNIHVRGNVTITDNGTTTVLTQSATYNDVNVNAEVDNALDTAIPGGPTADSINERVAALDDLLQAGGAGDAAAILADTNELQTDDIPGLIAAVQADTDDIQTRLPASLVGGRMDSDAVAISGSTAASDAVEANIGNLDVAVSSRSDFDETTDPVELLDSGGTAGTSADELVDDVWDEELTGATHNVPTSSGRRLRQIQDLGLYEFGAVWIDTVNGTAGTTDFENGTVNNPVDSLADAKIIADSVGLARFRLLSGSSITLAANFDGYEFIGEHYNVALGGQSLNGTHFQSATITGNDDGSNPDPTHYLECVLGDNTLGKHIFSSCLLAGTITLAEAADYFWDQCFSGLAGTAVPGVDFQSAAEVKNLSVRHYSGGLEYENFGAGGGTHLSSLEGHGQVVLNANCAGGTIAIRGHFTVTDNASGAVTLSDDARIDVAQINAAADTALADYDGPTHAELISEIDDVQADIAALNDLSAAEVNAQVDTALSDIHLDHLLAVDYDPASKPGVATALLNELVEDDGGVSRYTANALEEAPSGGASAADIATEVWNEPLPGAFGAGEAGKIVGDNVDAATSSRAVAGDAMDLVAGAVDSTSVATDAIGADELATSAVNEIRDAILDDATRFSGADIAATLADTNELQTDWTNGGRLDLLLDAILADTNELQSDDVPGLIAALNDISTAQVNTEVDTALTDIGLDHLLSAAVVGADVIDDSAIAQLAAKGSPADWDSFSNATDSLEALRDFFVAQGLVPVVAAATYDPTTMIGRLLEKLRNLVDEPSLNAQYTDAQLMSYVQPAYEAVLQDVLANSDAPIVIRHDLVVSDVTAVYILPPIVGEILRLSKTNSATGLPEWEIVPRARLNPSGPGFTIEGNTVRFSPPWRTSDTLQLEFIPTGGIEIHTGDTTTYDATSVTLSSSPTLGTLDKRENAYAGSVLRALAAASDSSFPIQDRTITAYDAATRVATVDPAFSPEVPAATTLTYEVVPMIGRLMEDVVTYYAATLLLSGEGDPDRVTMLEKKYAELVRAIKLRLVNIENRVGDRFEHDTPENARMGGWGLGTWGQS